MMRDQQSKLARIIEYNPISTWLTTCVGLVRAQDWKLIVRSLDVDNEALSVVKGVRILVVADGLAGLVQAVALGHGLVDVVLPVADAGAGFDALVGLAGTEER